MTEYRIWGRRLDRGLVEFRVTGPDEYPPEVGWAFSRKCEARDRPEAERICEAYAAGHQAAIEGVRWATLKG